MTDTQKKQINPARKTIGIVILVFFGILMISQLFNDKRNNTPDLSIESTYGTDEIVLKITETGLLKSINPEVNEAFVNPLIWSLMDFPLKTKTARNLAIYCGRKKGSHVYRITIRDNNNGKSFGTYREGQGLEVE
jgi:hypothetical protein